MLPHMTTPNTARDLDVIRAALGEKKLNFLGVSYGTYLGAVYGTLFPGHVRRMIVDSVVNPAREKIWYQANLDQDVAFQGRWNDWQDWVAENDATFHLGDTARQGRRPVAEAARHRQEEPDRRGRRPGRADRLLPERPVLRLLVGAGRRRSSASTSPGDTQALVDAAAPDLSDTAGNISSENGNAVYTAVECTDAKWPTSWKKWDRDNTRLHKKYPFMTWSNAWMNLPCATWPVKQQTPVDVKTGKGLPPVLIVQSTRDAATPYDGRRRTAQAVQGLPPDHRAGRGFARRDQSGQPLHQHAGGRLPAHRQAWTRRT